MKSFILRLILVLVAVMAFNVDVPESKVSSIQHALSQIPFFDIDPVRDPTSRTSDKKINYIAEPFIAIVVLADSLYKERDFTFYLPCYELHYRQRHFLLI